MDTQPSMGANDFDPPWIDAEVSVDMLDMLDGLSGSMSDIHIVRDNNTCDIYAICDKGYLIFSYVFRVM
jgi:hypothetical protein